METSTLTLPRSVSTSETVPSKSLKGPSVIRTASPAAKSTLNFGSAWPIRFLIDHPQESQFTGGEFRAGLEAAGLRVEKWRQLGEWGVMGQADKQ